MSSADSPKLRALIPTNEALGVTCNVGMLSLAQTLSRCTQLTHSCTDTVLVSVVDLAGIGRPAALHSIAGSSGQWTKYSLSMNAADIGLRSGNSLVDLPGVFPVPTNKKPSFLLTLPQASGAWPLASAELNRVCTWPGALSVSSATYTLPSDQHRVKLV